MKFLVAFVLLAAVAICSAKPVQETAVPHERVAILMPVETIESGPQLKRRVRQFGYDNTNFDAYSQSGNFGGFGGYGGYQDSGFDYSQQQGGFGGGFGGGYGGFGGGFGF